MDGSQGGPVQKQSTLKDKLTSFTRIMKTTATLVPPQPGAKSKPDISLSKSANVSGRDLASRSQQRVKVDIDLVETAVKNWKDLMLMKRKPFDLKGHKDTLIERFRQESLHPKAKVTTDHTRRDESVLEGPETALVVPDEAMLRHASKALLMDLERDKKRPALFSYELDMPPVPTRIVPLSKDRQVLLKIGNTFLRVGDGSLPMVSKYKPPLYQKVNLDEVERLQDFRGPPKMEKEKFDFADFTFYVDETATLMESWYRNTRAFFNIRIAVRRNGRIDKEYVALCWTGANRRHLQYQTSHSGTWWQLLCVGNNRYVCESITSPNSCLVKDQFGLTLSKPMTKKDRAGIRKGRWPNNATLTIYPLPAFAVWKPRTVVA